MKTKKLLLAFLSLTLFTSAFAQNNDNDYIPFFDSNGDVAIQTEEKVALADTIAIINHRKDDIIWARIVYRVIDTRDRQNNQLYFPVLPSDKYKSLLRLIYDETVNKNLIAYDKKSSDDIYPNFKKPLSLDTLSKMVQYTILDDQRNTVDKPIFTKVKNDSFSISDRYYELYAQKQFKFLTMEIVFFDKHYSRMFTKIIGIAPVYYYCSYNLQSPPKKQGDKIWLAFCQSVPCWYYFDKLRPYLVKYDIIPNGNEVQRMSYDDFFAQRMYSSYLLGDGNMHDRMLLKTYLDNDRIVKEQKRIETELLNTELDLWEY
jgi:gliding motility associated protien GldN